MYELTRDLFEKQRVQDLFLEQHKDDNKKLNHYYQNRYKTHADNKHKQCVYMLPYEAVDIRRNYRMMWFTTSVSALFLGLFNPYAPLVLMYDFYLLVRATQVMNQTCNLIILEETKRHV